MAHTSDGHKHEKDGVLICTVAEEDGESKIIGIKEFIDPEQRGQLSVGLPMLWLRKDLLRSSVGPQSIHV